MPMAISSCYECGDDIEYEMDDLEAEAYFLENPHVNRDVDLSVDAVDWCDNCRSIKQVNR